MKRIRTLVLGLLAVFALNVGMGAATASASTGLLAEEYPASFDGKAIATPHQFKFFGTTCNFTASLGQEGMSLVQAPSPTTIMSPSLPSPCWMSNWGGSALVSMNGCRYILNPETETFDIGPAGCGPIKFDWPKTCDGFLYPKSGLSATYKNASESTVEVQLSATGLKFDHTCFGLTEEASYSAAWTMTSLNVDGEPIDVQLDEIPGVYLAGAGADAEANQPRIEADGYPATLLDGGAQPSKLTIAIASLNCTSSDYQAPLTATTSTLAIDATYGGCTTTPTGTQYKFETIVDMNSCNYVLGVQNVGPPYAGTLGVACDEPADRIEWQTYTGPGKTLVCTTKIGPQSGNPGVGLDNVLGAATGIDVNAEVTGIDYELVGINCLGKNGSHTDGVLSAETSLFD